MSSFTDVVVLGDLNDSWDPPRQVSIEILLPTTQFRLTKIPEQLYPGSPHTWDVWVGAANYFDISEFVICLRSLDWEAPESVVVLHRHEQNEERWETATLT
jgi:hypothetical protein